MKRIKVKSVRQHAMLAICVFSVSAMADENCKSERYPTPVVADYVLACMSANGNGYETLHKCSCSVDYISERMDYADYEKVQTVMSVRFDKGQRGIFFRDSSWAKNLVERFENLQAESTLRCF